MKHQLILIVVLAMLAVTALNAEQVTATKSYQDTRGFYIVQFEYSNSFYTRPATSPLGCPHYDATITVFKIKDGKPVQVGKSWQGTFTDGRCYEDKLSDLVGRVVTAQGQTNILYSAWITNSIDDSFYRYTNALVETYRIPASELTNAVRDLDKTLPTPDDRQRAISALSDKYRDTPGALKEALEIVG